MVLETAEVEETIRQAEDFLQIARDLWKAAGEEDDPPLPPPGWEVAMLEAKGRISLSRPVEDWVRSALRAPGTRLLPLTPEIAIESTRLPGSAHGDPADRILIASARVSGGRLATRDRGILDYAGGGHVAVVDVTP
jgi:hypothetical protein